MDRESRFAWIPVDRIIPDPDNPREVVLDRELVESIKKHGLKEPLSVWQNNSMYVLTSGHRRLAAAKHIGLKEVPAIIGSRPDDKDKIISLREVNQVRKNFTLKEEIELFKRFKRYFSGISEEEFIKQAKHNFGSKANKLLIYLRWPEKVLEKIEEGKINASWVEFAESCVNTLISRFKNDWPEWLAPPEMLRNLFYLFLECKKLPKNTRSDIPTTPTLYKAKMFFEDGDEELIREFFTNDKITLGDALEKAGTVIQKEAETSAMNTLKNAKKTIMRALQRAESVIEKKGAKKIVEEIIELCWEYLEKERGEKKERGRKDER